MKPLTITYYIAIDGKRFTEEPDCITYEESIQETQKILDKIEVWNRSKDKLSFSVNGCDENYSFFDMVKDTMAEAQFIKLSNALDPQSLHSVLCWLQANIAIFNRAGIAYRDGYFEPGDLIQFTRSGKLDWVNLTAVIRKYKEIENELLETNSFTS